MRWVLVQGIEISTYTAVRCTFLKWSFSNTSKELFILKLAKQPKFQFKSSYFTLCLGIWQNVNLIIYLRHIQIKQLVEPVRWSVNCFLLNNGFIFFFGFFFEEERKLCTYHTTILVRRVVYSQLGATRKLGTLRGWLMFYLPLRSIMEGGYRSVERRAWRIFYVIFIK